MAGWWSRLRQRWRHTDREVDAADDAIEINVAEKEGKRRLARGVLVDSGTGVTIADGAAEFPEYVLEPADPKHKGQTYRGPGKQGTIANRGQRRVPLRLCAEEGQLSIIKFQDGAVRRPILSVLESTEAGNTLVFDADESVILPKGCPEQVEIRRLIAQARRKLKMETENGVFKLNAWVEPPGSPFAR